MTGLLNIMRLWLSTIELTELSTMNCRSTFKAFVLCQLPENCNFQSSLKPGRDYASCQLSELTTVAFIAVCSFHFLHLWICHTVNYNIPAHMWVRHTLRNVIWYDMIPQLYFLSVKTITIWVFIISSCYSICQYIYNSNC